MRHVLPDLEVTIAGRVQRGSSSIATVGGYVVVLASTLPARGVTFTSCYLAHPIGGDSAASHLLLVPGREPRLVQRVLAGPQPGTTHARGCLLNHVAELHAELAILTRQPIAIDVGPLALERATRLSPQPPAA